MLRFPFIFAGIAVFTAIAMIQYHRTALFEIEHTNKLHEEVSELRMEALLHDTGKIGVPDQVLNKPGKLTDGEFDIIKSHTTIGDDILAESSELLGASDTARYHHERYDGKGYPTGLSGKNIPVHTRIVSIADAYDAMHSDRVYRKGLLTETIRAELVKGRGTQFDPEFLDAFLSLFDSGALDGIGGDAERTEQIDE